MSEVEEGAIKRVEFGSEDTAERVEVKNKRPGVKNKGTVRRTLNH
jgi:hypothetical protein